MIVIITLLVSTQQNNLIAQTKTDYHKIEQELRSLGIRFPYIVMLQWREESGNGTSPLAVKYHNTLGMKFPYNRPTMAIGKTKSEFAIYKTRRQGFKDYKIWQDKYISRTRVKTRQQYVRALRKIYAFDKNYLRNYLDY